MEWTGAFLVLSQGVAAAYHQGSSRLRRAVVTRASPRRPAGAIAIATIRMSSPEPNEMTAAVTPSPRRLPSTTTLVEDTITTFETQLHGKKVVFEPHAHVLAEEPRAVDALWKQRLRWARGNVSVTSRYSKIWFRPSKVHHLGAWTFGIVWFSLWLLPLIMVTSAIGLAGLLFLQNGLATSVFRVLWISAALAYLFVLVLGSLTDATTSKRELGHILLFPGIINMLVMITALFPPLTLVWLPGLFGITLSTAALFILTLAIYIWIPFSMVVAWLARRAERTRAGRWLAPALIYLAGYGSLLCAITFDSYLKELAGAEARWDKTEKVGRVAAG